MELDHLESLKLPAVYSNRFAVIAQGDGMVKFTFGEKAFGETTCYRSVLVTTLSDARELHETLGKVLKEVMREPPGP